MKVYGFIQMTLLMCPMAATTMVIKICSSDMYELRAMRIEP